MDKRQRYLDAAITEKSEQPVDRIIDAHAHIGQIHIDDLPVTPERLITYMDNHGVDQTIVHPLESPLGGGYYSTTRDVLAAADRYPERIIPFCSVDPRMFYRWGTEKYEKVIRRYVERGARGFGELKCDLPIDHEYMHILYEICDDESLPVLIHIDEFCCTDELGLPNLESVVAQYSDVDFILHAPGWWAHITADNEQLGGYPKGPVEPGGRCDELLTEYENLYADYSMTSGFNALTRDEEYGQQFLERHHESLIFGSDYLRPGQQIMQFGFFELFELDDEAWANICYRNIESLLL